MVGAGFVQEIHCLESSEPGFGNHLPLNFCGQQRPTQRCERALNSTWQRTAGSGSLRLVRPSPRIVGMLLLVALWLPEGPLCIRHVNAHVGGRETLSLEQSAGPTYVLPEPFYGGYVRPERPSSAIPKPGGQEPERAVLSCARYHSCWSVAAQPCTVRRVLVTELHFLGLPAARPRAPCYC